MRNALGRSLGGEAYSRIAVLACAASAGAHAGLVPAHLQEEPRLGAAFLVAVVLLVSAAAALVLRPRAPRVAGGAALLLAGLIVAYLATRTTGIPVLDPEREAVDAVGIVTSGVEAIGMACALWLMQPLGRVSRPIRLQEVSR